MTRRATPLQTGRQQLANELRKKVRQSGMTYSEIARKMGIERPERVIRFVDGRDSQISTVEGIAEAIGYRLVLEKMGNERDVGRNDTNLRKSDGIQDAGF